MPGQLQFERTGLPEEVVTLMEVPRPEPAAGEVLVEMRFSPINPADLNFIAGTYGTLPDLPSVPGMEGSGVVGAIGAGVTGLAPGDPVLVMDSPGNWSTWRTLPMNKVIRLPDSIDPAQAAMLRVNPATAWGLLHEAGPPVPGSWVLQNAGSSAAGHCVIQLARALGLKTLSLVRRAESVEYCKALGGDLVFLDDADGLAQAKEAMARVAGDSPPALALNAVGGESALRLMNLLGPGGKLITYGAMSRQALKVPNGLLIFKGVQLRGFWLGRWLEAAGGTARESLYLQLADRVTAGSLKQQIARIYPLQDYAAALQHAAQSGRDGKVLLEF